MAFRSEAFRGSSFDEALEGAEAALEKWPEPYSEAGEHFGTEDVDSSQSAPSSQATAVSLYEDKSKMRPAVREFSLRSRSTCRDAAAARMDDEDEDDRSRPPMGLLRGAGVNKRKEGPSSGSSEDGGHKTSSDSDSPPTRQYCTQACLLGLKRGWDLDENCPNTPSHRTGTSGTRHPIDATKLAYLVG